ncbi:MBL fold metallo-hydrolase [Pelomonas sp. APW6]|uniref:beta-lactamase n=1 Tax=Roseateles subflavus TaxID=3053353 RepID=A0ABT7LEZ7_9BURK|nr:MBL fold metallo-hydrolase [Pelomonas sp. APW6]MDL5031416.1 MBL fold metallo-hydrolase [Pelomonas sp. APW6]
MSDHPQVQFIERGWLSANMIVLGGDTRGPLVIDTGYASHAQQTLALVEQQLLEHGHTAPRALLNTHLHSDHCGGNAQLQARYGCPLWIPPAEFEAAEQWNEAALTFRDTGQRCERFTPHARLQPGDTVEQGTMQWHVHAAPGHDPASVLLFEPRLGLMISADALWERGFGIVFPEIAPQAALGAAFDEVEQTLDLIQALSPRRVLPGHGPQFSDLAAALQESRSRLAYFRSEPVRHALHAAKALLMYHLLEWRQRTWPELQTWLAETPVQTRLREQAGEPDAARWAQGLVVGLTKTGQVAADEAGVRLRG